ncbi:MAG: GxxExxY protein [Bacteroidota bacterium]|jgi:GxxExxY protein|nr:GxxExxY protein [Cytophagales bacterium]MCE2955628.1 GxxExxY protein [Flammeovirgaceae bacterium]MCZ8072010.1 GxxExxY protein [Cytophagales bacterium]
MTSQNQINDLAFKIVGCAIEVHKQLGPGLLESIYEECICEELNHRKLNFVRQVRIPVIYKTHELNIELRLDVSVEDPIICELKAIETMPPVHRAEGLPYLKLLQKPKGMLINFHTDNVTKSMIPLVNEYVSELP